MAYAAVQAPESIVERITAPDGLDLAVETFGAPSAPGVVFAHGFGQTRHAWSGSAAALAASGYRAVTYDARGHGDSDWRRHGRYSWDQMLDDLISIARTLPAPPVLIGASMGGLI